MPDFKERKEKNVKGMSLAVTGIHGYGYYNTRTRPVNIIPVPAGNGYLFLIFVFYPL